MACSRSSFARPGASFLISASWAAANQPSPGSRKWNTLPATPGRRPLPLASSCTVASGRASGAVATTSFSFASPRAREEYRACRAPISEFPARSRRPNQGAFNPGAMVSSHNETSASSTAVGFRSTPYTLCRAMYAFTRCSSAAYSSGSIRSPVSSCRRVRYSPASCRTASIANAPDPRAGSQIDRSRISAAVVCRRRIGSPSKSLSLNVAAPSGRSASSAITGSRSSARPWETVKEVMTSGE